MILTSEQEDGLMVCRRADTLYLGKIGLTLLAHLKNGGAKSSLSTFDLTSDLFVPANITITSANENEFADTTENSKEELSPSVPFKEIEMISLKKNKPSTSILKSSYDGRYQATMGTTDLSFPRPSTFDQTTSDTPRITTIRFSYTIAVYDIPRRDDYTKEEKDLMWFRKNRLHHMVRRNRIERLYEQVSNGGKALEEEDYCLYRGRVIHPAHLPPSAIVYKDKYVEFNRITMLQKRGFLLSRHRTLIGGIFVKNTIGRLGRQ